MTIEQKGRLTVLKAGEGFNLKLKSDIYRPSYIDEQDNKVEEHIPYYFKKAYVPNTMSLEKAKELYEEVKED